MRRHFADWGDRLSAAGLAVLFLDSFSTRGFTTRCRVRGGRVRVRNVRVRDRAARCQCGAAVAAGAALGDQESGLAGWLGGRRKGFVVAVRPHGPTGDRMPDFRTAVAFYPGCQRLNTTAWAARVPDPDPGRVAPTT